MTEDDPGASATSPTEASPPGAASTASGAAKDSPSAASRHLRTIQRLARRLEPFVPSLAITLVAGFVAWAFVYTTLRHNQSFGLPLDDAYIYLTYAKQFGRAEPFSYYPGGGYSAGSTSVAWPMLLAPFWTLGARGHSLVWVSFGMCAALYAATGILCNFVVREMFGKLAGFLAALLVLAIAPFAWTSLSGMEVGLASMLLVCTIFLLMRAPREGKPGKLLIVCLAATSLSRPESMLIVGGIVGVCVISRLRQRDVRAALSWASPLIAPIAWLVANRVLAGNWFPNTGVAKSHFYLPGFDWSFWHEMVNEQTDRLIDRLFTSKESPLMWPNFVGALWYLGAFRVLVWAQRERRWLAGLTIVSAPFVLVVSVIATSGQWDFHNYRYIAPAFPLIMLTVGCAIAVPRLPDRIPRRVWAERVLAAVALIVVVRFVDEARPKLKQEMLHFAQNVSDMNDQVVKLGLHIQRKLPRDARVMFHDAGAIAYYGDTEVFDMLGLVTNGQAGIANNGPGARFEFLEAMPVEQRPTHFAYYPGWMGQTEFYGEVLLSGNLKRSFHSKQSVGGDPMQIIVANWDHIHSAERPTEETPGWHMIDRVDVADLAAERAHEWEGALGRRKLGEPTAKWSFVQRQVEPYLMIDGGRTIRGAERFTITVDPARPIRLVLRTGGPPAIPWHENITKPVDIGVFGPDGRELDRDTIPPPNGMITEIVFELRSATPELVITIRAKGAYRSMHWFVLQPD